MEPSRFTTIVDPKTNRFHILAHPIEPFEKQFNAAMSRLKEKFHLVPGRRYLVEWSAGMELPKVFHRGAEVLPVQN